MTKNTIVGVRLPERVSQVIKRIAESQGRTASDLLGEYAGEIARQHQFCDIEFRSTPLGRMAYVRGTRTPVWLVSDLVRQENGNVKKIAKLHEWPETRVRAALNYAKAFPEEIEPLIAKAGSVTLTDLQRLNAA